MTTESAPHTPHTPDAPDAPARIARGRALWPILTVAVAFGLFYVYDLFEALSNLFGLIDVIGGQNRFRASVGAALLPVPWTLLITNIAVPVVVFFLAAFVGRRRSLGVRALLFLAGLTTIAAISLSITALA